jgi:hypothetical protein
VGFLSGFQNPALLAGALLFAVPLVIHLLNRQRHRKRPWAAMEFLLRAYQKQRNRLRTENLLLLLLRCLLPIALALAVARPLLHDAVGMLAGTGVVHHVLVVDASYSMGLRQDGAPTPFERARQLAGRLLDRFEQNQARSDKVTLVSAGVRPRFLVRSDLDLAAARNQWFLLQRPEDAATDLGEAMAQVAAFVETSGDPDTQVYVFTDSQARAAGRALEEARAAGQRGTGQNQPGQNQSGQNPVGQNPAGKASVPGTEAPRQPSAKDRPTEPAEPAADAPTLADSLRDTLERLQHRPGTAVHWIDVGPAAGSGTGATVDNTQLTGLRIDQPIAVLRTPVAVVASVHNRSSAEARLEVTLEVDGTEPQRKVVTVPAFAEGEAEFQVVFREPGRHRLRAALVGDGLDADDERHCAVLVRDRVRVLLVDGLADGDPLQSYRQLWQPVLDPDPTTLPTFAVQTVDALALLGGQVQPIDHDVTVLADVDRLNQRAAENLVAALRAGRGLLVAAGERLDPSTYNLWLHAAGEGPQPFRFTGPRGGAPGAVAPRSATQLQPDHSVFAGFREPAYRELFAAIPTWRWHGLARDSLAENAQVLARLDDPDQSPLLVAAAFGEGKVVFWCSAPASPYLARRWNRFDDPLVAFPLLHGLVEHLALPASDPFQASVGQSLSCSLPARPTAIELQRPERDGGGRAPLADEPVPLPGGRYALPPFVNTLYAGCYTFELLLDRDSGKEAMTLPFAVNVDPAEGDLRYAAHDELQKALGLPRILTALPATAGPADPERNRDLGPHLLLTTLLLLLAEAALARYVAVRRSS